MQAQSRDWDRDQGSRRLCCSLLPAVSYCRKQCSSSVSGQSGRAMTMCVTRVRELRRAPVGRGAAYRLWYICALVVNTMVRCCMSRGCCELPSPAGGTWGGSSCCPQ